MDRCNQILPGLLKPCAYAYTRVLIDIEMATLLLLKRTISDVPIRPAVGLHVHLPLLALHENWLTPSQAAAPFLVSNFICYFSFRKSFLFADT